ncbi:alpha glucosidase-like protein [Striga asiatica]|uniref:Alpha glucosidase-like protein n=1 Tax=Striga asiatica TaxID=4170 RepID=A0A5A7P217_STRAF|nr:alpha glucosidase-like protein [Striga asiatica]
MGSYQMEKGGASLVTHSQQSFPSPITHGISRTSNGTLKNPNFFHIFNSEFRFKGTAVARASLHHSIRKGAKRSLIDRRRVAVSKMTGYEGASLKSEGLSGKMIFEPILEEGIFRFDCSADDRNSAFPSISFQNPKARDTPLSNVHQVPAYIPSFECVYGQQIVNIEFPPNTSFYGTGEVSGQLERTGKRIFTWNTDAWGYGPETTSLYQSHPWVLAVLPSGEALGVLADTTRRCEIDLREESHLKLISTAAYPVITFGPFASPTDVLVSFSRAVGTVFMPPKWSLGYHQCRWSYDSDARVREIARTFREKGIPCDVIWMDIDYMDGFRCFTFDKARYFPSHVWPGPCVFPDFTQSGARSWWANLVKEFIANGVDGIWNDMNEPAVFKTITKTMPDSNIHRADSELGGHQNHSHYHNVYGMLMAKSTYEGMKLANEKKRPFVLTRAGFVGSQRYAATWTGDNLSTWEHLHMSISMVVQLGLSGQPLSGPDIGGFAGNATPKMFGRWMGFGAMFPFCRGHSETDTADHEPWCFGEEIHKFDPSGSLKKKIAGKAEGFLFEDDGDGYEYTKGGYLLTTYAAEKHSSVVIVKVLKTEGSWTRPNRRLNVKLLLGKCAMIDAWGVDGETLEIPLPPESEVPDLVLAGAKQFRTRLETAKRIPDQDNFPGHKGTELSRTPVEIKSGDWALKVVPWIGGRVISMQHLPSGTQWLHSRVDINGYEEYSSVEFRSAGCSEEYLVVERGMELAGEMESLQLEGDIGGGLALERQIYIPKDNKKIIRIDSGLVARKVGAGSGGFSRSRSILFCIVLLNWKNVHEKTALLLVCLRVHPTFNLLHPTESYVSFTAIDGSKREIWPESGELALQGEFRPNGEWRLIDRCLGLALVNRFNTAQVYKCLIHWGTGTVNLELWSEERPVSKGSPLKISHEYEVIEIP